MSHSEHECRNDVRLPWSEVIHKIMTQVHILRIHLSSLCKVDCKVQIKAKQKSLNVKQHLPDLIKNTIELLKSAHKDVRMIWREYQSRGTTLMQDQEEAYIASIPNMCPKQASRCFKKLQLASAVFSELPAKKHRGGGLSSINIPIPTISVKL